MQNNIAVNNKQKRKFIIFRHKAVSAIIGIILIAGGYFGIKSISGTSAQTQYVLGTAEKGTLVTSISASGQVSASNQIDLKPKASGNLVYVGVQPGQEVKTGTLIAQLDTGTAQKAVRDAQTNLESAQLSLQKLQSPPDKLSLLQAEDSLTKAKQSKQNAQDALTKSYDDGYTAVSNAFLDLPSIMTGLQNILLANDLSGGNQWNIDYYANIIATYQNAEPAQFRQDAYTKYQTARTEYDKNFSDYKASSRYNDPAAIKTLIDETYVTTKDISEAINGTSNLIQLYKDTLAQKNLTSQSKADIHLSNLSSYIGKTNSALSSLLSIKNSIQNNEQAINSADAAIQESAISLEKLQAGTDSLDIRSAQITVQQRQNALNDAQQTLADYYVRAPFDGVVATVNVAKGDGASSGTAIATLITSQRIAEVALNEIDAAKIKIGQNATLTFDAIDGLSIAGQVTEIDTLGTVSQGVVSYNVKINFDTQDSRVKPGMSVSASIITEAKIDVLMVPNSAVKQSSAGYYVQVLDSTSSPNTAQTAAISQSVTSLNAPQQITVDVGIANDSYTEITSGLKEGDQVITKTVAASSSQTASSFSLFGIFGGNRNVSTTRTTSTNGTVRSSTTNSSRSSSGSSSGNQNFGPPGD